MQRLILLGLALALAGCAVEACPPSPMPATAAESPLGPRPAPPAVPPAVGARLKLDSAAVQQHARQYVARPSTPAEKVEALEPLTRRVNRTLAVMEWHRRREGRYRATDVRAARSAADAVAAFLNAQPPPREDAAP